MATALTIINRALRLCKVLDAGQAATANDAQDALSALNNLGQRWLASGLIPAWTDADAVTDTLVTAASANEALAYSLALKVAPEYGATLPEAVVQMAASELRLLWRDRIVATSVSGRTAGDLAMRALRILNGASPTGLPDAVSLPAALVAMNAIGQRWLASGLVEAWTDVAAVASAVSTPAAADEALVANLALRLAPEYGIAITEPLAVAAAQGMADLWRDRLASSVTANTAEDIILRALRVIASAGRLPDSVNLVSSLATLNALLAEWYEAEIGLPDYTLESLADPLASDLADRDALAYALAIRLAPEYGVSLSPEAVEAATTAMSRLRLRYFQPNRVDPALPSTRTLYDIEAG